MGIKITMWIVGLILLAVVHRCAYMWLRETQHYRRLYLGKKELYCAHQMYLYLGLAVLFTVFCSMFSFHFPHAPVSHYLWFVLTPLPAQMVLLALYRY